MIIGYARVSTAEQNPERQIELLENNYKCEKIYLDKLSGKDTNRPQLQEMLSFIREGDILVVESYSRLARSTKDLLTIVSQLREKNVSLQSDKEKIDTSTPQGKLFLTIMAGLAEFERECILQRQKEGIEIAKRNGKYAGRKPIKVDEKLFKKVYEQWRGNEITARQAQRMLKLKPDTFYRRVRDFEKRL